MTAARKVKFEQIDWSDSDESEPEEPEIITEENSIKISDRRCPYCTEIFKSSLDLIKHEKNCIILKNCNAKRVTCKDGSKKFICQICCSTYKYLNMLQNHEKKHKPPGGFICKYCDFRCCLDVKLEKHKEEAHTEFLCRRCNLTFETKENYIEHIKIKHDGYDKDYKICEECGRQFRYSEHLNYHKKTNCQTIFPFKCNVCEKSFRSKGILKTHSLIHSGEKNFCCTFCPMSFICKAQVIVHERKHTGEKPYKCDICSKAFAHRESLVTHSSTHTGMKPYLCECCDARFSCVSSILAHRRTRPNSCGLPEYCTKLAKACPRPSVRANPTTEILNVRPARVIKTSEKEKLLEKRKIEKKPHQDESTRIKRKRNIFNQQILDNNSNKNIDNLDNIELNNDQQNKISIFTNKRPKRSKIKVSLESDKEQIIGITVQSVPFVVKKQQPEVEKDDSKTKSSQLLIKQNRVSISKRNKRTNIKIINYAEGNKQEIDNTIQSVPLINESNLINQLPEMEQNVSEIQSQLLEEENQVSVSTRERSKRNNIKIVNYAELGSFKQITKVKKNNTNIKSQLLVKPVNLSIFTNKRPKKSSGNKKANYCKDNKEEIENSIQPIPFVNKNQPPVKDKDDSKTKSSQHLIKQNKVSERKRNNIKIVNYAKGNKQEIKNNLATVLLNVTNDNSVENVEKEVQKNETEIDTNEIDFFEEIKIETCFEYCQQNENLIKKNETCNSNLNEKLISDQDSDKYIDSLSNKYNTSDSEDEPHIKNEKNIDNKCTKLKLNQTKNINNKKSEIFECIECIHKLPFLRKISYEKHLRNRHKKTDNEIYEILSLNNHKASSYSCKICGKSFTYSKSLIQHIKLHGINGNLIIKCKTCLKYFATKNDLLVHAEKYHKNQITCLICDKMYPDVGALQAHKRYAHTEREKNNILNKKKDTYICNKCGKIVSSKNSLNNHELSNCGTEYLYKCDVCGKALSSPAVLKTHMMIHSGEVPYLCPYCSKGFRTKAPMIVHQRMHTGEKPFQCTYCEKTFAYRESLFIHLSTHTGIKRFMCTSCSERFSCISGLQKHWKTHADTCGKDPNQTTKAFGEFVGYRKGQLENKKKTI